MADSEKLTALKKAYADIILNTAKEAAARIMLSERKAEQYRRELMAAKDEALRMLLRLKQLLDSKVSEAEMKFLSQQKRIEELEAQLGEAEDIVEDLRIELRESQEELEKLMKTQAQPTFEQNSKDVVATQVATSEENRLSASDSVVSSLPAEKCSSVTTNGKADDENFCMGNGCCTDNCFSCNQDFSIVIRSKEHELYRNGCTQRIRAFEQNQLGGNLSHSGKSDSMKSQICSIEAQNDEQIGEKTNCVAKISDKVKLKPMDRSCIHVGTVRSFHTKRNRDTRYKKRKPTYFKSLTAQPADKYVKSGQDSRITVSEENLAHPVESKSLSKTSELTVPAEITRGGARLLTACTVQNVTNNDKSLTDGLGAGRVIGSADSFEIPPSKGVTDVAGCKLVNLDQNDSVATEMCPTQPMSNKYIKYTFQRKRKKECLSNSDVGSSPDTNASKRKTMEKQSVIMEPQNSDFMIEPFRDSQRLAQVARQLLSLSEEKWR